MKIVIELDDNVFVRLFDNGIDPSKEDREEIEGAIRDSIVLPKGHGDLIDRKELLLSPYRKGGFVEWYDEIKYAKAIIPADKEESE